MKRTLGYMILVLILCTACGQEPEDRYDEGYQAGYAGALAEAGGEKAGGVTISGSFTAMVRDVIPDYCLDDTTPQVAVVTLFQDAPFALYVGEELGAELEVGTAYVFEIEEKTVQGISPETLAALYAGDPAAAVPLFHLRVSGVRPAGEGEYGLEDSQLTFKAANVP